MTESSVAQLEPTRIPIAIARDLGRKIVSGRLHPGTRLEGEVPASLTLNVSRTAYREAIRLLVAKGLVECHSKVGSVVSEQRYWHLLDPDVLSWIFESEAESKILASLLEIRCTFEPEAAALAAQRRSAEDLLAMEKAIAAMVKHTLTTAEGQLADEQFHLAVLQASGNIFMRSLCGSISAAVQWTNILSERARLAPLEVIEDHRRIYEAIRQSDAAAARRFMRAVIDFSFSDIKPFGIAIAANSADETNVVVMRSDSRPLRR